MESNRAAWLDAAGKKLRVDAGETPNPGPDEVVVRNRAVAINPVDWKIQDYGFMVENWPTVLGMDAAGEVVQVGKNVEGKFKKGDRVFSRHLPSRSGDNNHAAFQLYSVASVDRTAKIPDNVSFTEASVLPVAFETAVIGLSAEEGKGLALPVPSLDPKPSGKILVVWGGSSSVGALAIQLAVAAGVRVLATSSKHNFDFCKKAGAAEVFDHSDSAVVEKIVDAIKASGAEFAGVYDTVSLPDSYKSSTTVAERLGGGTVAVTLPGLPEPASSVKATFVSGAGPFTHPFWKDYLPQALEQGKLKCLPEPVIAGEGLDSLQTAFDVQKKGVSAKKVVVTL